MHLTFTTKCTIKYDACLALIAGHELTRRLTSRTQRLLGINPKYGFSTVKCRVIYQSGPYYPFEYAPYPSEKWMIIQKPSGSYPSKQSRKWDSTHVLVCYASDVRTKATSFNNPFTHIFQRPVPKTVSRKSHLVAGIHQTT
ncbi:hypothetical protein PIB30_058158 [Stylosanthes scabra]|uniref:Uncharacterized protein n=1 Tax=Stylosanthes scabra TaxID=79078 RepID=A0ABU6QJB7_9FABA|nr:hypothetical protein [Stylosanthes scabra]